MRVSELLNTENIRVGFTADDKKSAIESLMALAEKTGRITNRAVALQAVLDREDLMSTGLENGVAIPHAKTSAVDGIVMALGISREGMDFSSADGAPSHLFFLLLAPESAAVQNIKVLSRIAGMTSNLEFRRKLLAAETAEEAYDVIFKEEAE